MSSVDYEFTGEAKKGQAATISLRKKCVTDLQKFLKSGNFAKAKPSSTGCCEDFGDDEDEQDIADELSNASTITNQLVEKLGEIGAIAFLQLTFEKMGFEYDPDNLAQFSGNGCFNAIYFHPSMANPTYAIILEAKGGTSTCGDRDDGTGSGMRVQQGTPAYAEVIMAVMAGSPNSDRADAGTALQGLASYKKPRIAYLGVRTPYDKTQCLIYDPVPIFFETV